MDLRRIANRDDEQHVRHRPDEGDDEGDEAGRDAAAGALAGRARRLAGLAHRRSLPEGPVIHRHVVAEPWPGYRRPHLGPGVPEGVAQEAPAVLDRVERPEAVDDPDLEPRAQERAVAPAPRAIF